ncbi:cation:proton antiporter [Ornithinimicrobium cavernae]|uniref:cation:proton antiporter n=1 Tax=Ornithinimicrobium cavernae TaxID=2666047 RepID=UPI000D6856E1|nr:sodium:proton antiporter [Ornithinimicrobium cavernae]
MEPVVYLGAVLVVGALAQWLAWAIRIPSILVLLVVGFAGGTLVSPDEVLGRDVLFAGVTLAVGIILFEGSLTLRLADVRDLGQPVRRLCSVTVLIAWALITGAGWLVGLELQLALLVGAILVVTGPTVINPILRQLRPTRRVSSLLRWEGIVVDPIGAILALLVYQAVLVGNREDAFGTAVLTLLVSVGVALLFALVLAVLVELVMVRHLVPDYLHGTLFIAVAACGLVGSNMVQSESGLLTVTVLGIVLGNRRTLHLEHVKEFYEHLQVLLVGVLFVILAGRITPQQVLDHLPMALVFVSVLILVVRPVSIWLGLLGTGTTRQERLLMSGMAPRGIVAAAVTSIFALELEHAAATATGERRAALARLAEGAEAMVPLVFVTIVVTVAVYGLGVGRLAERLGLATTNPQGVVFAGSQEWVRQAAGALGEAGVPTVLVSQDARQLHRARMEGVRTERSNILSDYALNELDLAGIGSFIAATDDDGTNTTAAREFGHTLGRANVYQLRRADVAVSSEPEGDGSSAERTAPGEPVTGAATTGSTRQVQTVPATATRKRGDRTSSADRLSARAPFRPALTHEQLEERVAAGMVVRRTRLTETFTLEHYLGRNPDAVLLFTHDGTRATVLTEESDVPDSEVTLIALAPPRGPDPQAH